jgi:tetratricopeptide (TPR) repeat protein
MPTVEDALQHGWQLHQSGHVREAEAIYRNVLAQLPKHAAAFVYLGIALFDQRRFEESVAAYRSAIQIQPHFPIAWNNLGNSLRMQGDTEQAEFALARALEQQPGYLSALKNRGTLWIWAGEVERGLKWYQEGLSFDPNNAELHRNLGVIHLLLGNYDIGWPEYRWRWRMPGLVRPACNAPIWNGEDLRGKSILLYAEQGRGDAIQFIRLAPILTNAGAHVIVQCDPVMIPLFSCIGGIPTLVPEGITAPAVDYQASLVEAVDYRFQQTESLPFGTELSGPTGQYIVPPQSLLNYWNHWLSKNTTGQRIGINWQGNPDHHADVYRSIPLETLAPLASLPNTTLVNLQFGHGSEQLSTCTFRDSIVRLPSPLDQSGGAFMDTAAIVASLDVIVTTDTAIAHLAGALGKRVLLMLGKVPDWRWLTSGDTTPWYPSMKLIRQTQLGEWSSVVDAVVRELNSTQL